MDLPNSSCTSPFYQLSLDCIHLILHYHIFHLQHGNRWRNQSKSKFSDSDYNETSLYDLELEGMNNCNWNFLRKFAHSCHYFGIEGLEVFLSGCRDWKLKPTFHYIKLKYLREVDLLNSKAVEYLRGIQEFHFHFSAENVEDMHLVDWSPFFTNIRGVKKLSLNTLYVGMEIPFTSQYLENLRGIQEAHFFHCDFSSLGDDAFENLRGIQFLNLAFCTFRPAIRLLEHLRGIQKLELNCCEDVRFSAEELQNIRGVKSFNCLSYDVDFVLADQFFEQLRGVQYLDICAIGADVQMTDVSFKNLQGIKKLKLSGVNSFDVTDSAMVNLRGVDVILMHDFPNITSAALENFRGIKELCIKECPNITWDSETLKNLRGIEKLEWKAQDEQIQILDNETLKHLCGVRELILDNASITHGEVFRYLSEVRHLDLNIEDEDTDPVVTDADIGHLVKLRRIELSGMDLRAISTLSGLLQLPELEHLGIITCALSEGAIAELQPFGLVSQMGDNVLITLEKKNGEWIQKKEKWMRAA